MDEEDALHLLKWIGKVVSLACNTRVYPFKDNETSRIKANEAEANKHKLKQEKQVRDNQKTEDQAKTKKQPKETHGVKRSGDGSIHVTERAKREDPKKQTQITRILFNHD